MRTRLLALAVVAAAAAGLASPASAAPQFDEPCTGKVDTFCYHDFCQFVDCTRSDCVVYVGILGGGNAGICVGLARGQS